MTAPTSGHDLDALRAAVARIEAGGSPHRPPRPSPDLTQSGDGHLGATPGRPGDDPRDAAGGDGAGDDGVGDGSGGTRSDVARDPHEVARAIVLRQLGNAPKTRAQLHAKLLQRGCDAHIAEQVLQRFTEVGLVDDAAYAETYVHAKQLTRGLSRQALLHELRGKGVPDDIAADVLDRIDEVHEAERARDLVRARLGRLHGLDREAKLRRLSGLLARKGYSAGLAARVILEEVDAAAEHQRD